MHARRLGELRVAQKVPDPVVDDKVVGAFLVGVDHRDDPAEQLLLEAERRRLVAAARLVAGAAAERRVEPGGEARELGLGRGLRRLDHLLAEQVALEQENEQHLLGLQGNQVQVLDARQRALRRARHRRVLGDRRQRHRDPLHHPLLVGGRAAKLVLDVRLDLVRDGLEVHQEVDEIAVAGIGRHPPRRRVRLGQVAQVDQVRELAADRGRGEVDEVAALERLRPDRHGAGRELVHHRPQDRLLSAFHLVSSALSPGECQ